MGYKAAQQVFKQWRILRGDKVWMDTLQFVFFKFSNLFGLRSGMDNANVSQCCPDFGKKWVQVMVMAGKDAGLTGTVQKVIRAKNRVIVEGRNLVRASTLRT